MSSRPVSVEAGPFSAPTVLFLHGWPESWATFERVMSALGEQAHCLAIDLPGIGGSETPLASSDKRALATFVHGLVDMLDLRGVTLVGYDVGAQIVYAYLHEYPNELTGAILMNIVIPGVDPWSEVVRNPSIWHFAFHAIPELPETLVTGRQAAFSTTSTMYSPLRTLAYQPKRDKHMLPRIRALRRFARASAGIGRLPRMRKTTSRDGVIEWIRRCSTCVETMNTAMWNVTWPACAPPDCGTLLAV
jgi:pimeloyl-ACP methyl ester carboxylesterase